MKLLATPFVIFVLAIYLAVVSEAQNDFEVWGADQSNSAPNMTSLGIKGGFLWIWDSKSIEEQLSGGDDAKPLSCSPSSVYGPCDLLDVFPQTLAEYRADGSPTGNTLGDLEGFGRFHGALRDPQGRYVNINMFAPGGGYVGVVDSTSKESVALFRVTKYNFGAGASGRSVHMSFWTSDGSAIIVANLNGKAVERINVKRDYTGTIVSIDFDKSASLGLGQNMSVSEEATFFLGENAFGNQLIGGTHGSYSHANLQDLTPNKVCKENNCEAGDDGGLGGRANNLPICPVSSQAGLLYITLAGGGLFVADTRKTPMKIVGEYGSNVVYGAGCGGVVVENGMLLNPGVSASAAGATQSMFALWRFNDSNYLSGDVPENEPLPDTIYQDERNTLTGGNIIGTREKDLTGQIPGKTTRRDSHGATATSRYVHVMDRVQNVVESFDLSTYERSTYDLTSVSGEPGGVEAASESTAGVCRTKSVTDDPALPLNDPAPDLIDITLDQKFIVAGFRGPAPVSVSHSGQGSCPGVGLILLLDDGRVGKLVTVLRASNTLPDAVNITSSSFPGGVAYAGSERSDVHHAIVVPKP